VGEGVNVGSGLGVMVEVGAGTVAVGGCRDRAAVAEGVAATGVGVAGSGCSEPQPLNPSAITNRSINNAPCRALGRFLVWILISNPTSRYVKVPLSR
jgi:hypothetical protein